LTNCPCQIDHFSTVPVQLALDGELRKLEGQRRWKNYPGTFERAILQLQERGTTYLLPDRMQNAISDQENAQFLLA
jgi:hypothetical protein